MQDRKPYLEALFRAAIKSADPVHTVPAHLPPKPEGRVVVVGAGKASARMAEIVETCWGDVEGLVLTRYGYARPTKKIKIVEAAHPVPDQAGLEATKDMVDLLLSCNEGDTVLALISGGASSLSCLPSEGLSLADKQELHEALLASGAPISDMNLIRKHFSGVKGGQLAAAAYPATVVGLLISDVPGDDPGEIGSGPTVGEDRPAEQAYDLARSIGLAGLINKFVAATHSTVIPTDDQRLSTTQNQIIAAPIQALKSAAEVAGDDVRVEFLGDALEGEAKDLAVHQIELAKERQKTLHAGEKLLLLSGGECTVSGRGTGVGGPNAEFALAAAIALAGCPGISLLAGDTDGVDGAADIAGAFVDSSTLSRAAALSLDPMQALEDHDSHSFFGALDDQIITGPTLTNVNDFRAILIEQAE